MTFTLGEGLYLSQRSIVEVGMNMRLRPFEAKDMDDYYLLNHPSRPFHQLNGPYFKKLDEKALKERVQGLKCIFDEGGQAFKQSKAIALAENDAIIGEVSWYWKSEETKWLEVGIVIFDESYWQRGVGSIALKEWVTEVFDCHPEIVRIGLTTWSGNKGMIQLAENLGMKREALYRKARIVNGRYYDSISYGLLRDEWQD